MFVGAPWKTRFRWIAPSLLLLLALLGTSCTSSARETPLAFVDEEITLTMWGWEGTGHELLLSLIHI